MSNAAIAGDDNTTYLGGKDYQNFIGATVQELNEKKMEVRKSGDTEVE